MTGIYGPKEKNIHDVCCEDNYFPKEKFRFFNSLFYSVYLVFSILLFSIANLWWFLGVADTNDVIQKIEKTLNNTHTTTQKLTNNSFRNTKKHPNLFAVRYLWDVRNKDKCCVVTHRLVDIRVA